jgi:hypothetical protein
MSLLSSAISKREDTITDKRNASKEEKSEARQKRREARRELGLKEGDGKEAHHIKEKGSSVAGYNNCKSNLKAMSKEAHKATASNGVRGKDCKPRKKRAD